MRRTLDSAVPCLIMCAPLVHSRWGIRTAEEQVQGARESGTASFVLAAVPDASLGRSLILSLYLPQLQKERGDHEATREHLRQVEEEHEKLRSSECTG